MWENVSKQMVASERDRRSVETTESGCCVGNK